MADEVVVGELVEGALGAEFVGAGVGILELIEDAVGGFGFAIGGGGFLCGFRGVVAS
jgi:hypothetical protein